jgi:hypothetical protein
MLEPRHRAACAAATTVLSLTLTLAGCGGEATRPPATPVAAPSVAEPPPADETPTLDVNSGNVTEVRLDGKSIGNTPIKAFKVAPGKHEVTFVFSESNSPTLLVELGPGESKVVTLDPPPTAKDTPPSAKKH